MREGMCDDREAAREKAREDEDLMRDLRRDADAWREHHAEMCCAVDAAREKALEDEAVIRDLRRDTEKAVAELADTRRKATETVLVEAWQRSEFHLLDDQAKATFRAAPWQHRVMVVRMGPIQGGGNAGAIITGRFHEVANFMRNMPLKPPRYNAVYAAWLEGQPA